MSKKVHDDFNRRCVVEMGVPAAAPRSPLILLDYFQFAYYLCICPFRIAHSENSGYQKHTFKPQLVACVFCTILIAFRLLQRLRLAFSLSFIRGSDPVSYFYFATIIFSTIYKCSFIKRFWFNSDQVLALFNHVSKARFDSSNKHGKYFVTVLLLVFTVIAAVGLVGGVELSPGSNILHFENWLRDMLVASRETFFVVTHHNVTTDRVDLTPIDISMVVFTSVAIFQRYVVGHFGDLYILLHAITLWISAQQFSILVKEAKMLSGSPIKTWYKLYEEYKYIRGLSYKVNQSLGSLVTLFLSEAVFFYSINLDYSVRSHDFAGIVDMISFYSVTFAIFLYSANIQTKVNALQDWLSEDVNRGYVPQNDFQMVLVELQSNKVGIKGNDMFTITYGFTGNVLTLVITYFIICLQQRESLNFTEWDVAVRHGNYNKHP